MDKQHAVITVNTENKEHKLHDLGTLNGVSFDTIVPTNFVDKEFHICMLFFFTNLQSLSCLNMTVVQQCTLN